MHSLTERALLILYPIILELEIVTLLHLYRLLEEWFALDLNIMHCWDMCSGRGNNIPFFLRMHSTTLFKLLYMLLGFMSMRLSLVREGIYLVDYWMFLCLLIIL